VLLSKSSTTGNGPDGFVLADFARRFSWQLPEEEVTLLGQGMTSFLVSFDTIVTARGRWVIPFSFRFSDFMEAGRSKIMAECFDGAREAKSPG
jgi:hypothetical protein